MYYGRQAMCTMVAIHVIRRPSHNALCVEKYVLVQHDDSMIVVKWHDNKRLYIKKARAKRSPCFTLYNKVVDRIADDILFCDFACKRCVHELSNDIGVAVLCLEEHKLGNCGLNSAVIA